MKYPDYPLSLEKLDTETCIVSDSDIPSGSGGINGERYTYGQLRHQPIIPELMRNITNSQLKHTMLKSVILVILRKVSVCSKSKVSTAFGD